MKFTTRDLFLVTLIVALAVGWWVDRSRLVSKTRDYDFFVKGYFRQQQELLDLYHREPVPDYPASLPNSSAPAPNPPKP